VRRVGFFSDGRIAKKIVAKSRMLLSLAALTATVPVLIGCVATPNGNSAAITPTGPLLQVTPSNINFTSAVVGVQTSQTLKLTNDGGSALTVTGVVAGGTGLSISGFSGSTVLSPGASSSLTVLFTPKAAGAFTGSVAIMTNTASVGASLPVTANATSGAVPPAGPQLQVTPSNINFTSAVVGVQTSQTLKLTNDGGSALTVTGVVASGTGLSISGFSGSTLLSPGTSSNLTVLLTPKAAGAFTGSVAIMTNTASVGASLPVTANATSASKSLTVGPASLSFGTVAAGKSASRNLTITNTGNQAVTVTGVSLSGSGFSMTGWSSPVTLDSTQSLTLDVMFDSTATGSHTGALTVASTAAASQTVPLSGTVAAEAPAKHSVGLSWDASTSASIAGYNVYRGGSQSGPFTRLNGSLVSGLSYTDGTVVGGDTYFYVTTAVDSHGDESPYSNTAKAVIP
jgi:hypothetical protein